MAAADYYTQVYTMFVAYFGRPPAKPGLENYANLVDKAGGNVAVVIDDFFKSDESKAFFAGKSVEQQVNQIFQNVFGRDALPGGLNYWTNLINNGTVALAQAAYTIAMNAAAADLAVRDAKIASAKLWVAGLDTTPEILAYGTDAGRTAGRDFLKTVTTSTPATQAATDAALKTMADGGSTPGQTFTLTNSATADTIIGTAGNDTISGPTGTVANGDIMIDQSSTDADVANLVLTAAYTPSNITKIETVNLDWDAYGTASYALAGVTGAKAVNLTSAKVGFLGSATVTGVNDVTLTAGSGMTGTLTASGFKTGTVQGGSATALVIDGSTTNANNASITVNAGTATTSVSVGATNGFKAATINAGTAGTVLVKDAGNLTDTTALTVNKATVTITNTGSAGAMTLTAGAGNSITMNDIGASLTVLGDGDVTLTSTGLTGETVTNSKATGNLTIKTNVTTALDLSKVQATLIEMTGVKAAADTVATGANLKYSGGGAVEVIVGGTATTDAVTAEVTTATLTSLTATGVETLTVKAAATAVSGADLTIGTLATGGNKVVFTGTNDVTVTSLTGNGNIDATALAGDLVVTGTAASNEIKGGTGKLTVTSTGTTTDVAAIGQTADDTVTASVTTGSATAILGDGKNTVSATGLTTGTLVVTGGSGIDTVTAGAALSTGVINLNLGDGANVINSADNTGAGTRIFVTGGGDDAVSHTGGLNDANDVLNWTAGAGTDTLILVTDGADLSPSTKVTLSGVEEIKIKADADADATTANATFSAAMLSGQTYTIKADANQATTSIAVKGIATTTAIDLSTLTMSQSVTSSVSNVKIDASANLTTAVTISGTSVKDTIIGGDKGDTIVAGNGADTVTGGKGNDSIDLTETLANSAADTVVFIAKANNGADTIIGFKSGTDKLSLLGGAETTVATGAGAAAGDSFSGTLAAGAADFTLGTGAGGTLLPTTSDVVLLSTTLSSNGNLSLATDGTELLKSLSSTTTASTGIAAAANGDAFYLVAYQSGNAYLYAVDTGANSVAVANEITLIGTLTGITAGSLAIGDFTVQS